MRLIDRMSRRAAWSSYAIPETGPWEQLWSLYRGDGTEPALQTFTDYSAKGYRSSGVVFACILARVTLFSQAEFKWQSLTDKRLFGTTDLTLLENPWPGGTTAELLARMEQDVSLAGNAFIWRAAPDRLVRLRPDWVDIVSVEIEDPVDDTEYYEVAGYVYWDDGRGCGNPRFIPVDDVAHWSPLPDPLLSWRGVSWLDPIVREINADSAMTSHKRRYFDNGSTPGLLVRYPGKVGQEQLTKVKAALDAGFRGVDQSGRTLMLDEGADVSVVGASLQQADLKPVQGATETRICMAAGVPPIVIGAAEGLDSATYSNYRMAHRAFADGTVTFLWRSAVSALAKLVTAPPGARLWYSTEDIPAMQEAETARAEAAATFAGAASTLITAGYEPSSVQAAIVAGDFGLLVHSGLMSVQLQQPGTTPGGAAA